MVQGSPNLMSPIPCIPASCPFFLVFLSRALFQLPQSATKLVETLHALKGLSNILPT